MLLQYRIFPVFLCFNLAVCVTVFVFTYTMSNILSFYRVHRHGVGAILIDMTFLYVRMSRCGVVSKRKHTSNFFIMR